MTFPSGSIDELLKSGVAAARSGDREWARFYLEWVLGAGAGDEQRAEAWYWLSSITDDIASKRECLQKALVINPNHVEAGRELAALNSKNGAGPARPEQEPVIEQRAETAVPVDRNEEPVETIPAASVEAPHAAEEQSAEKSEHEQAEQPEEMEVAGEGEAADVAAEEEGPRRTKCPQCGATIIVYPGRPVPRCQFCGYDESGTGLAATLREQRWAAALYAQEPARWELPAGPVRACGKCRTKYASGRGHASEACPVCGSSEVRETDARELQQPEGVIPFMLGREEASASALRWLAAQWSGREIPPVSAPRAVYLPFWSFTMGGDLRWKGMQRPNRSRRGKLSKGELAALAAEMVLSDGSAAPSDADQSRVQDSGAVPIYLNDLVVPAVTALPDSVLDGLKFDMRQVIPYAPGTLTDTPAALYSISLAEGALRARVRAMTIAGDRIFEKTRRKASELLVEWNDLSVLTFGLVLLPVWLLEYSRGDEQHTLAVNAQSGQVAGDAPPRKEGLRRFFRR